MSQNGADEVHHLDELESLRNAPLEIILANPAAKIIYDMGFKMGQGLKEVEEMEPIDPSSFLKIDSPKKSMTNDDELPKDMEGDVDPESAMDDEDKFHSDVEEDEMEVEVEITTINEGTKTDSQIYDFKEDDDKEKEKKEKEEEEEKEEEKEEKKDEEEEKEEEKDEEEEEEEEEEDDEDKLKVDLDSPMESDKKQVADMDDKSPPRDN